MKLHLYVLQLMLGLLTISACAVEKEDGKQMLVYTGTYTEADSQGIEIYRLNEHSGELSYLRTSKQIASPSYLCFSGDQKYLFAVNELLVSDGNPTGTVSAFVVDPESGSLQFINARPTQGRAPCYLTVSQNNRYVLLNNYLDGRALSLPIAENGALGPPAAVIQMTGSGPLKSRQEASHLHSVNLDPQNKFALIADLGSDKILVFDFDAQTGQLNERPDKTVQTTPGAGPRHLTFSVDGTMVFVANELNSTVETFRFDPGSGSLQHNQTLATIPPVFKEKNYPADIHLSPDGRFLYVSNRGHESIAIFKVEPGSSIINLISTQTVFGSWPRNFVLSRDGKYLLVANQKSNNIVVFGRDVSSGLLSKLSEIKTIASPACLKIGYF